MVRPASRGYFYDCYGLERSVRRLLLNLPRLLPRDEEESPRSPRSDRRTCLRSFRSTSRHMYLPGSRFEGPYLRPTEKPWVERNDRRNDRRPTVPRRVGGKWCQPAVSSAGRYFTTTSMIGRERSFALLGDSTACTGRPCDVRRREGQAGQPVGTTRRRREARRGRRRRRRRTSHGSPTIRVRRRDS